MAGLLDIFRDPETSTMLGLLSAYGMAGKAPQGLLAAHEYMAGADDRKLKRESQAMQKRKGLLEIEDLERKAAEEKGLIEAARNNYVTPGAAEAASMGPMPDGSNLPMVQPGLNMRGFIGDVFRASPLKAMELEQSLAKQNAPVKVGAGDSLVDPKTFKPLFTAPKEQSLPAAIQEYQFAVQQGFKGDFNTWDQQRRRAGATNLGVTVNTEKSYGGEFGKLIAQQDAATIEAARSAPQRVQTAQQVMRILDTQAPITGTGAEARLGINKALSTAGLIDGQSVKSTEDLAALLASQTLDAIKTSGLGGGQGFTDKDRQFLERARSGNIETNAATLRTLALLNERAARATIQRGRELGKRLQGNKDLGWVTQGLDIADPPPYAGPSIMRKPQAPASAPGGVRFLGFE